MKEVFVTGSKGLVGSRFVELLGDKFELLTPEIDELDLTDKTAVKKLLSESKPDAIVHLAAYTDVGKAEEQRGDKDGPCHLINVGATDNLVRSINSAKTHFIYISTDMVFSGKVDDPGPYAEDHPIETDVDRVTWYGWTKGLGEQVVGEVLGNMATVLRIIYPVRASFDRKLDYLRRPLQLFDQGKLYPMFADQQVSIAFIDEVVLALQNIIDNQRRGVFHAGSRDSGSPYEIISYLIEKACRKTGVVKESSLRKFLQGVDNPVRYPIFGGLSVEKTEKELGIRFSTWREIIDKLVKQGIGSF